MTEKEKLTIEEMHRYHGGGQTFPVTDQDLVFVIDQNKKRKATGYNHTRAWQASLAAQAV